MVEELLMFAGIYVSLGAMCAAGYWVTWRGRFYFRHVWAFPFLMGCMLWDVAPPAWMKPSERYLHLKRIRNGEWVPSEEVLARAEGVREWMRAHGLDD